MGVERLDHLFLLDLHHVSVVETSDVQMLSDQQVRMNVLTGLIVDRELDMMCKDGTRCILLGGLLKNG